MLKYLCGFTQVIVLKIMQIKLKDIQELAYHHFVEQARTTLANQEWRCQAYFAIPSKEGMRFVAIFADNHSQTKIISHTLGYYDAEELTTSGITQMLTFEREITELHGVHFKGHPWAKPVRFPFNRFDSRSRIENYPFYDTHNHALHLVNVGPVHAGVIEPGAFRFICDGEKILHLEIALGYQHRGVEHLICSTENTLRQIALAESIAGDSTVAHAVTMSKLMTGQSQTHFSIALEMERIAMHLADIGALCMDVAYQLGQVACEALRTLTINTMQRWCGNRFGKSLIRPIGCRYPLDAQRREDIGKTLTEVVERFESVARNLLSTPTVLARFEEICCVSQAQALAVGATGMAARSVGLERDARMFGDADFVPCIEMEGDLMSRLRLRIAEIRQSYKMVMTALEVASAAQVEQPSYGIELETETLYYAFTEGWRGEVVHCGVTDGQGKFGVYKVYDPSFRNWMMLALSVRGALISDFPLSNKSYNLSYCGHDL